jgi:hypothetical protein
MKRALIHVGLPKTGTTAIQSALVEHRQVLASYGLHHPETAHFNHPATIARFHPAGTRHWYFERSGISPEIALALSGELWRQVTCVDSDVILSCEFLYDLGTGTAAMARAFEEAGFEPIFIAYVRHPVDAATSASQQELKSGTITLEHALWQPGWHDAKASLSAFVDAGVNVVVRDFGQASERGVTHDLFRAIGYDRLAEAIPRQEVNNGLTMDGVILADLHARYLKEHGMEPFPRELVHHVGSSRFALPQTSKLRVREASREEVRWLSATFGVELQEAPWSATGDTRLSCETVMELMRVMSAKR